MITGHRGTETQRQLTWFSLCLCVSVACLSEELSGAQAQEAIAEILVHGNHTTPDTDILAIAGLSVGEPASQGRLGEAERKLRESGRFEAVEVRRRFRSIANPSEILIILLVDERPGVTEDDLLPGPLTRLRHASLWLPILNKRDGYALTYGGRVTFVDPLGPRTRLSVPLTWGGERRAAVEMERSFERGPLTTLRGTASIQRRENPHFKVPDLRREVVIQGERSLTSWLRAGAHGRVTHVTFGDDDARYQAAGAHLTLDTRVDPSFPRNAVHATAGWGRTAGAGLWSTDLRGYVGLVRSAVLALRGQVIRADAPLPLSEQALLGGSDSLRGYRAGHQSGDSMATVSAEVRVPLTSPLSYGRFGVKAFVDAGATWASGERLRKQQFDRGIGGGVYFGATAFAANVDVAWPEQGKPRVHAGVGVTF